MTVQQLNRDIYSSKAAREAVYLLRIAIREIEEGNGWGTIPLEAALALTEDAHNYITTMINTFQAVDVAG